MRNQYEYDPPEQAPADEGFPTITPDPGPFEQLLDKLDPVAWIILVVSVIALGGLVLFARDRRRRRGGGIFDNLPVKATIVTGGGLALSLFWLVFIS